MSTGGSEGAITSLIIYVLVAFGFSFLCSIWEAVLLSTSFSHIELLVKQGKKGRAGLCGIIKKTCNKASLLT